MFTPLHCAASDNDIEMVRNLIQDGMDINVQNPQKESALMVAVQLGHLEVAKHIVTCNASLTVCNDQGQTALHMAVLNDYTEFVAFLLRYGIRVNDPDSRNNLPLHYAVKNNNLTLVRMLLKTGSKGNTLNKMFESPAHIAVRMYHMDILRELVSQGCDVNVCSPSGNVTPLHIAVNIYQGQQFRQIAAILLEGGCSINARAFSTLETPLYRAIDMCKTEVAEYLLLEGADANLACPFDVTSLQKACYRNNFHLVKLLLHCGINWKKEKWIRSKVTDKIGRVTESEDINNLLQSWRGSVTSLQNLCRIKTRTVLGGNLTEKLQHVFLPRRTKDFLMLSDVRLHC